MATRLNITIPDDVATALEPHRETTNVSAVCANALRKHVEDLARNQDLTGMERAVARLRAQREARYDQFRQEAYEAGWHWVLETASYEELLKLDEGHPLHDTEAMRELIWTIKDELPFSGLTESDLDTAHRDAMTSIQAGIRDAWNKLKPAVLD